MEVQNYLFLEGRCEEAIEFYKKALGAEVTFLMRMKDSPEPSHCPPGSGEKILHSSLRIGTTTVLASDGMCSGKPGFQGFGLSIFTPTAAEADRLFAALSPGGEVKMALEKTFWSERFGMVADRFGVLWMIGVDH